MPFPSRAPVPSQPPRRARLAAVACAVAVAAVGPVLGVSTAGPASAASGPCTPAALVAVDTRDDDLYRWRDADPATAGGFGSRVKVGVSWASVRLIASDDDTGNLFAVTTSGDLKLYKYSTSAGAYQGGTTIGHNWDAITRIVPDSNGVLYAVTTNGDLRWYRWTGSAFASGSGTKVGSGWDAFSSIASGGNGVLYGIRKDDKSLQWYRNSTTGTSTAHWSGPRKVGNNWNFTRLVGAGDGILYAFNAAGTLYWYNHTAAGTGAATWATGSGTTIGTGWSPYDRITTNPTACTSQAYALPVPDGMLARSRYAAPHHDYPALDLPVPVGTPVRAIRAGTVAGAGDFGRCGLGIQIDATDGGRYVYCHLSQIDVSAGQSVATGARLGESGNTGRSTGPHLHVGIQYPTGTSRCPQRLLLAVYDGASVPAPSSLPTSGCFYATADSTGQRDGGTAEGDG